MTAYPERQKLVMWINLAVSAGATKFKACQVIGVSIRTLQRWVKGEQVIEDQRPLTTRPVPTNKLSASEVAMIKQACLSAEFADTPPSRIVPVLADRGQYIASESSFYRILNADNLLSHRSRAKGFTATKPNQVWSWDITHLPSRVIGGRFYLYMIEDIAEIHDKETGEVEKNANTDLVLHSDNGSPMKSFTMQAKMYELGVIPSHSRPTLFQNHFLGR